jgi:hypothetical protein
MTPCLFVMTYSLVVLPRRVLDAAGRLCVRVRRGRVLHGAA